MPQESTLVVGPSGVGKSTLFRAISGLWPFGSGEIQQPAYAKLMLLPQRPYIPIGRLRDALAYPAAASAFSDAELRDALIKVGLAGLRRTGSTSTTTGRCTCPAASSSASRSPARCWPRPDWLFLDEATASLDEKSEADLYRAIAEDAAEHDAGVDRPPLDAQRLPQAPHRL